MDWISSFIFYPSLTYPSLLLKNSAAFKKFAREEFGVEGRLTFETDTEKAIRRQKTYTNVLPVDPSMIPKIKGKKSKIKKGTARPTEIHDPNHAKMQRERTMLAAARGLINLPKQALKPGEFDV